MTALEDYTAGVIRARKAYHADMAAQSGLCANCQTHQRTIRGRRCTACIKSQQGVGR